MDTDLKRDSELIISKHTEDLVNNPQSPTGNGISFDRSDSGYDCTSPDKSFILDMDKTIEPEVDVISILLKRVAALESSHDACENVSNQISNLSSRIDSLENISIQVKNNIDFMRFQFKENQESVLQISKQLTLFHSALSTNLDILKNDVNCIAKQDSFQQDLSVVKDDPRDTLTIPIQSPVITGSSKMFAEPSEAIDLSKVSVLHNCTEYDNMINFKVTSDSNKLFYERPIGSQLEPNFEPQIFLPTRFVASISTDSVQDQSPQLNVSADRNLSVSDEQHHTATSTDSSQSAENNFMSNDCESSVDDNQTSPLNVQSKILKSQMVGLKSLTSISPTEGLSKSTLLDLHKNRVKVVDNQTQNLQATLCDYVKTNGFCPELTDQVTDVIDKGMSWSSKIRELYQSTGAYKRSQGSKLFDNLNKFSPFSEIDIYVFLKRFESLTSEFDFPEERAEFLYNKFLSSSVQEEVIRYKNDYKSMKSHLIHSYGNPRTLISRMIEPLQVEVTPDNLSTEQTCLTYYRKLQSVMEKINFYLDSSTGHKDAFESYIFSQDFLLTLLFLVPLDAKLEFFKIMKQHNEDSLWIKGERSFKLLLSTVREYYELHERISLFHPTTEIIIDEGSDLSCADDIPISFTNGKGDGVSCQRETIRNCHKVNPKHSISDFKYPCILPGHNHGIGKCKEFFSIDSTERVDARKISEIKHCAICLQSSISCRGGKCSNVHSVPDVLLCQDCKQMNTIDKKRPCYSVLFCLSQSHQKPKKSDVLRALESYISDFEIEGDYDSHNRSDLITMSRIRL